MPRKSSQPALYELIRGRPVTRSPSQIALPTLPQGGSELRVVRATATPGTAVSAVEDAGPAPVRTVRVPIGMLYAAIAAALVALVGAYLYGVSVGDRVARDRQAQRTIEEANAAAQLPSVDPLQAGKTPPGLEAHARSGDEREGRKPARGGNETNAPRALGPSAGDPREPGKNYFVLASTPVLNGEAMVAFCRKNGLDAHLVPGDNAELHPETRLVIVTPGFASGERRSAAVIALETKIKAVGLKWKSAARSNRDFMDAYPKKYP